MASLTRVVTVDSRPKYFEVGQADEGDDQPDGPHKNDTETTNDHRKGPPWLTLFGSCVTVACLNGLLVFVARPVFVNPDPDGREVKPWEPYLVLNGVAVSMVLMAIGLPADMLLFSLSSTFCVLGVISTKELLDGLGNSGVVAVAALCIVSKAIDKTQALNGFMKGFLGKPTRSWEAMLRMALPVCALGTVFNNTPLVAVMIPIVKDWTQETGMQASHFMMPLSFVTMLSACITTMGSSTNLLAVQLVPEAKIEFFDLAPVGIFIMFVGIVYCCIFAPVMLPSNNPPKAASEVVAVVESTLSIGPGPELGSDAELQPEPHRYTVCFELAKDGPLIGRTAASSGILKSVKLPAVLRCIACGDTSAFEAGDRIAAINVTAEQIADLASIPGCVISAIGALHRTRSHQIRHRKSFMAEAPLVRTLSTPVRKWVAASVQGGWAMSSRPLYEVVMPPGGLLRNTNTESQIQEASIADIQKPLSDWGCTLVSKQGENPENKDLIALRGGEFLLVQAVSPNFERETQGVFQRVIHIPHGHPPVQVILSPLDSFRKGLSVLGLALCVGLSALEIAPLDPTAILVGIASVAIGTLDAKDLYGAVNGPVLLTVAGSFGVGSAFKSTGVASYLARAVLAVVEDSGPLAVLGAVVMLALTLGVVVSNNTTVILLAPMVKDICDRQGMSLKMVMIAVIYAANLSFATPFSYQTNMMVMPHGQYAFMDYVKFGIPMMVLCGAVALAGTFFYWGS